MSGLDRITRIALLSASATLSIGSASRAAADDFSASNVAMIASQACAVINPEQLNVPGDIQIKQSTWRAIPTERLAYFIVAYGRDVVAPDKALDRLGGAVAPDGAAKDRVADTRYDFQREVAAGNIDGIAAFGSDGKPVKSSQVDPNRAWLKDPGITVRCIVPEKDDAPSTGISWRLRGNVDALSASGNARKSADAASFGYSRTRTFQDDGSRTEANEISVDAVLGAVIDRGPDLSFTGFVGYQLKQNRAKPAPTLVPPATQRDGDTDLLTIGVMGDSIIGLGGGDNPYQTSARVTFSGSYLFDWVKDSERVKGQVTVNFYNRARAEVESDKEPAKRKPMLGLCDIGGFTDLGGGIWTQCNLQAIATYNQVTKHGRLLPAADDHFGHVGGRASATLYLGDPGKSASFFASAEYLNLWRYDGNAAAIPNIHRHSFALGHRWWQHKQFAFEVKAELTDGINPDSFADENALTLGFGVIF